MKKILFYRTNEEYGCFSNFAKYPIEVNGEIWPTSEHYYQAQKSFSEKERQEIRNSSKAMTAARMGRKVSLRDDWKDVRDDVMRVALYAKFTQYDELRKCLMETGDAIIIEHTEKDNYWADGGDGSGENMLGKLLMELRSKLGGKE